MLTRYAVLFVTSIFLSFLLILDANFGWVKNGFDFKQIQRTIERNWASKQDHALTNRTMVWDASHQLKRDFLANLPLDESQIVILEAFKGLSLNHPRNRVALVQLASDFNGTILRPVWITILRYPLPGNATPSKLKAFLNERHIAVKSLAELAVFDDLSKDFLVKLAANQVPETPAATRIRAVMAIKSLGPEVWDDYKVAYNRDGN